MNQQIIQIHWIDALINSKASFYRLLRALNFLNPSCLQFKNCRSVFVSDNSTKIIDILHNADMREQLKIQEDANKLNQIDRSNGAIYQEFRNLLHDRVRD